MHQSFTGSARRPRNINLSGRNKNPWANLPQSSSNAPAHSNSLVNAQVERERRQRERDRLLKAKTVQRVTRGWADRKRVRAEWRDAWDRQETGDSEQDGFAKGEDASRIDGHAARTGTSDLWQPDHAPPYATREEAISQLRLLVSFAQPTEGSDRRRITFLGSRLRDSADIFQSNPTAREASLLRRLGLLCIQAVRDAQRAAPGETTDSVELLKLLGYVARTIPKDMAASVSRAYFALLAEIAAAVRQTDNAMKAIIVEDVLALLRPISSETLSAYASFAMEFMSAEGLEEQLGNAAVNELFTSLNYRLLASALATLLGDSPLNPPLQEADRRLWLLARFINARKQALQIDVKAEVAQDPDYIRAVSILLGSLADDIIARIDIEDTVMGTSSEASTRSVAQPLPPFVRQQIRSLVQQNNVSNLLAQTVTGDSERASVDHAEELATYALTLLRVFPRQADDIRGWLFIGSTSPSTNRQRRESPVKFFWKSARTTAIFGKVSKDPRSALNVIKPSAQDSDDKQRTSVKRDAEAWDSDWRVILLFLELYTFILKFMDDEEFLSGAQDRPQTTAGGGQSWTREGALPLKDVKDVTVFLKHLAFTLYWNASDLVSSEPSMDGRSIREYFTPSEEPKPVPKSQEKPVAQGLAGMPGIAPEYLKGLVTGLLRMIHERE